MAALAHLGPDRKKSWAEGPIGLAHLLMRITREDSAEVQPRQDGLLSLVADLRIDNREDLGAELGIAAPQLEGMADSALLLAAFNTWGEHCVDRLIGDFAFAAWDAGKQELTLAVDPMGQRHIYYHRGAGFFAFASEIKGLWALPEVPRELDEDRVARSLLFEAPGDVGMTDFPGIQVVPGGSVLTVDRHGDVNIRRYWQPHADPAHIGREEAYYLEKYREILGEAVACRLRRAVYPAGLLMGGGFDSSAICGLAGTDMERQGRKLIAVSSVLPVAADGTISGARYWCEQCRSHMPHLDMRYVTGEGPGLLDLLEKSFFTSDSRRSPRLHTVEAIFTTLARAGARIVMDGHGGDYTLNPRGITALPRMLIRGEFRRFMAEFTAMRRHLGQGRLRTLWRNVILPAGFSSWYSLLFRYRNGLRLWGPTMPLSQEVKALSKASRWGFGQGDLADPRIAMEQTLKRMHSGPGQTYSIVGAHHGLEFTQPFHDKRVIELALAIPEEYHLKDGLTRYLARKALKDIYPPAFQTRQPGTDNMTPNFLQDVKAMQPQVLAEIDRMEQSGKLSRYFDFAEMRRMLVGRPVGDRSRPGAAATGQAMLAFVTARYMQWFRGDNA